MGVNTSTEPDFGFGDPKLLFPLRPIHGQPVDFVYAGVYDVMPDGGGFVTYHAADNSNITIVQNWYAEFKDRE